MKAVKNLVGRFTYYIRCTPFLEQYSLEQKDHEVEGSSERDASLEVEKRKKHGGWKCMPYIIGNETFEKVASFGLLANFTVYLVSHLNMDQVEAANYVNIFTGTANFAPLFGAFLSDAYWGRFRTLTYASLASFLGMVTLTLTAAVPQLHPPSCSKPRHCEPPSRAQVGTLIAALALLSIGAGGIRPCSLPFGVDQFDMTDEADRRGLESFFNWYYFTTTAAAVIAMTVLVYIQDSISWALGFAIPTGLMVLSIAFFFLGTRLYVHVPAGGSAFSSVGQVFAAALRKRRLRRSMTDDVLEQEKQLFHPSVAWKRAHVMRLPLTLQFRCLNKAAIICEGEVAADGSPVNPWRLCTVQQVEEVKCLLRIIPIWASGMICFVAIAQQWTFTVLQAMRMDRHLGPHFEIPPGAIGVLALISLTLFLPVYDQFVVPAARRITGAAAGITLLQRQGIGMVISAVSMVVAGLVESKRRRSALAHGGADGTSPMSALWLAPQLVLMGVAEAFNAVGQIEFYNRQFPEQMQSVAGALFFCSLAGASYLSSLLVAIIQKKTQWLDSNINLGRVDYYYYVIAIMGVANLVYFLVCAHYYHYKGTPEVKAQESGDEMVL